MTRPPNLVKISKIVYSFILALVVVLVGLAFIDVNFYFNLFVNGTHIVILGLILDVIGAILIIFPLINLMKSRDTTYDMMKYNESLGKRWRYMFDEYSQYIARIGLVLLVIGFVLQIYGNIVQLQ